MNWIGRAISFLKLGWIGPVRIAAYGWIVAFASLVSLGPKWLQAMGRDGSDFQAFWAAARLTISGSAAKAYDLSAIKALQTSLGRPEWFAFVNPPPFLLIVAPLGWLPYPLAWWAWVLLGWAVFILVARRFVPGFTSVVAGYPGALVAAWHAQTGLLVSALQAVVAVQLERRPFVAGLFAGTLVVKPHLAVLLPVAFVAGRHWRAFGGAVFGMVILLAISWLLLGGDTLKAYPSSWQASRYLMETGSREFFLRQCTVYSAVHLVAGSGAAAIAQMLSTGLAILVTWSAWRKQWSYEAKFAVLFAATPLATPYLFSYDLPFLVMPTIWLAAQERLSPERGWRRLQIMVFYLSPLLTRAFALPLGANLMPWVAAAMLIAVVQRATRSEVGALRAA